MIMIYLFVYQIIRYGLLKLAEGKGGVPETKGQIRSDKWQNIFRFLLKKIKSNLLVNHTRSVLWKIRFLKIIVFFLCKSFRSVHNHEGTKDR